MSTPKVVPWKRVREMLDACASGWTSSEKLHNRWIHYNGLTCSNVPLGPHGQRASGHYDIKTGKIRQLVWALGISAECASKSLGVPIPERP